MQSMMARKRSSWCQRRFFRNQESDGRTRDPTRRRAFDSQLTLSFGRKPRQRPSRWARLTSSFTDYAVTIKYGVIADISRVRGLSTIALEETGRPVSRLLSVMAHGRL
jgi:hypothetical protein